MTILPEVRKVPPITLATRLRLAREWRALDQQVLADEVGISRATVSNYETGKTKPGKLEINAWAVVCDVDVEWLKTGDEFITPDDGGSTAVTGLYQLRKSQNLGATITSLTPRLSNTRLEEEAA